MKKILALLLISLISAPCLTQETDFRASACVSAVYVGNSFGCTADLYFEQDISPFNIYCSTGLYFIPGMEWRDCGVFSRIGAKLFLLEVPYIVAEITPNAVVNGNGHQVYGDYLTAGMCIGLGVGAELPIVTDGSVYAEVKWCREVVLYSGLGKEGMPFFSVAAGYRYRFF